MLRRVSICSSAASFPYPVRETWVGWPSRRMVLMTGVGRPRAVAVVDSVAKVATSQRSRRSGNSVKLS